MSKRRPGTVFQPKTGKALHQGIHLMASALRPTLGPLPRLVGLARDPASKAPELLDDGATIARRILELPNPDEDMGAMLLRHTLWRVHEQVGDGTAATAVMVDSLLSEGLRYVAAGFNAMGMRTGIEKGVASAIKALRAQAETVEGEETIAQAAATICPLPDIAEMLAEVFDIVGAEGLVEIEGGHGRGVDREYVEGAYWESGWVTPYFVNKPERQEVHLQNAAILISDIRVDEPAQLAPLLQSALQENSKSFMLIAQDVSSNVIGMLMVNQKKKVVEPVAVKAPHHGDKQQGALEDIAILTGGRWVRSDAGDTLDSVRPEDLGRARNVWASRRFFGIKGGQGDPRALRAHINTLRNQMAQNSDKEMQTVLRGRISKLMGGVATVRVGGSTESERDARKAAAERAVSVLQLALTGGMVPGGGAALLACREAVLSTEVETPDEEVGLKVLALGLEEPLRAIVENAGYEASPIVAQLQGRPSGWGFDVRAGQICDMRQAGVWDATEVVEHALRGATSAAVMALTTDVLVHRDKPPQATEP